MDTISEYEVRCPRCDVSFPVSTKRCLHCGGKTGPSVTQIPEFHVSTGEGGGGNVPTRNVSMGGFIRQASPASQDVHAEHAPTIHPEFEMLEEEEVGQRPSILRSMSTVIWIALAILFSVMRACSEG